MQKKVKYYLNWMNWIKEMTNGKQKYIYIYIYIYIDRYDKITNIVEKTIKKIEKTSLTFLQKL